MVRAAASTAIHPAAVAAAARRRGAAMKAASTTSAVETTASTTSAVETTAASATAMTATTTLRERSRRAKQRQRCKYREDNLETSGPVHGCHLHPTTSLAVRAAGTPR